jgi:ankyrin repeat protein
MLGAAPGGDAFVRAVASGHRPVIDLFLAAKTDVNAADDGGRTALLTTALRRDDELTKRLLDLGADPRRADPDGVTPLMIAAAAGHLPAIADLRAHGAVLTATDSAGRSALHYAIAARQTAVVAEFFKKPADVAPLLRDGQALAELALATNDRPTIEAVIGRLQEKLDWCAGARAWCNQALQARDAALFKLLLAHFDGPPAPDDGMQPWLAHAVVANDLSLLEFLLVNGADPNVELEESNDPTMRQRLANNFMRNYVGREPGLTPLMLAAGMSNAPAVRQLVRAGANRNAGTTGKSRLLAIYFAGWADSAECVQALITNAPPRDQTRIEVSISEQRATFYKDGAVALETEISTGRAGFDTKTGEYVITDKHRDHQSTLYPAKMPFFMRLSGKDFGLHEGYVTGRPASHGCIRLPKAAAQQLFAQVPVGTWVSITR